MQQNPLVALIQPIRATVKNAGEITFQSITARTWLNMHYLNDYHVI